MQGQLCRYQSELQNRLSNKLYDRLREPMRLHVLRHEHLRNSIPVHDLHEHLHCLHEPMRLHEPMPKRMRLDGR
jgi:hypothetical protein